MAVITETKQYELTSPEQLINGVILAELLARPHIQDRLSFPVDANMWRLFTTHPDKDESAIQSMQSQLWQRAQQQPTEGLNEEIEIGHLTGHIQLTPDNSKLVVSIRDTETDLPLRTGLMQTIQGKIPAQPSYERYSRYYWTQTLDGQFACLERTQLADHLGTNDDRLIKIPELDLDFLEQLQDRSPLANAVGLRSTRIGYMAEFRRLHQETGMAIVDQWFCPQLNPDYLNWRSRIIRQQSTARGQVDETQIVINQLSLGMYTGVVKSIGNNQLAELNPLWNDVTLVQKVVDFNPAVVETQPENLLRLRHLDWRRSSQLATLQAKIWARFPDRFLEYYRVEEPDFIDNQPQIISRVVPVREKLETAIQFNEHFFLQARDLAKGKTIHYQLDPTYSLDGSRQVLGSQSTTITPTYVH